MLLNRMYTPDITREMSPDQAVDEALACVKGRITQYGLLSRFEESLSRFASTFHWTFPVMEPLNRKNTARPLAFARRDLEKIVSLNAIDLAFYAQVESLFDALVN